MIQLRSDIIEPFLGKLRCDETFKFLCGAQNSFEGWLKWELAAFCQRTLLRASPANGNQMGVEVRLALDPAAGLGSKKLVDFWIVENPEAPARYHYVELKVIFDNGNFGKIAQSALWDWRCLTAIAETEQSSSLGLLVFFMSTDPVRVNLLDGKIAAGQSLRLQPSHKASMPLDEVKATALYYELTRGRR